MRLDQSHNPTYAAAFAALLLLPISTLGGSTTAAIPIFIPSPPFVQSSYVFPTIPFLVGSPPQLLRFAINLDNTATLAFSRSCAFCPGGSNKLSPSTSQKDLGYSYLSRSGLGGEFITNRLEVAPGLALDDYGMTRVDTWPFSDRRMSQSTIPGATTSFWVPRDNEKVLVVPRPSNNTSYQPDMLMERIRDQLLNPLVGIDYTPTDGGSQISLGFVPESRKPETLTWIVAPPSLADVATIAIDGFRAPDGGIVSGSAGFPMRIDLSGNSAYIYMPRTMIEPLIIPLLRAASPDVSNTTQLVEEAFQRAPAVQLPCSLKGQLKLSVVVGGRDFEVDPDELLYKTERDVRSPRGQELCTAGIVTSTSVREGTLGILFWRSTFLAYRAPTDACQYHVYGLGPRLPSQTPAPAPNANAASPPPPAQCLAYTTPSSYPKAVEPTAPGAATLFNGKRLGSSAGDGQQIFLISPDELAKSKAKKLVDTKASPADETSKRGLAQLLTKVQDFLNGT